MHCVCDPRFGQFFYPQFLSVAIHAPTCTQPGEALILQVFCDVNVDRSGFCGVNVDGIGESFSMSNVDRVLGQMGWIAEIYCRFGQSVASSRGLRWHSATSPISYISHPCPVLRGHIDVAYDHPPQSSCVSGDTLFLHQRYILQPSYSICRHFLNVTTVL